MPATNLNSDLSKIYTSANQWKMTFNLDLNKNAQEAYFSPKIKRMSYPPLNFNNNSVKQIQFQKHFAFYLVDKLDFREHLQNKFKKVNNAISFLRKLQNSIPKALVATIYKSFISPNLDLRDILYDQTFNYSFPERLESIQYNTAPATTGSLRDSSR